jgi:hypothetical protein
MLLNYRDRGNGCFQHCIWPLAHLSIYLYYSTLGPIEIPEVFEFPASIFPVGVNRAHTKYGSDPARVYMSAVAARAA